MNKKSSFLSNIINTRDEDDEFGKEMEQKGLEFVYPFGSTLNVQEQSHPIMSTGPLSYPINRPVAAVYIKKGGKGKLVVIGSYEMFSDEYFEKEDNSKFFVRLENR